MPITPQMSSSWRHHTGKINLDYIVDNQERRKSRAIRKKTICTKADELSQKCGGKVFFMYIDEYGNRWVFCPDDDMYSAYKTTGLSYEAKEKRIELSNTVRLPAPRKLSQGACNYVVTADPVDGEAERTTVETTVNPSTTAFEADLPPMAASSATSAGPLPSSDVVAGKSVAVDTTPVSSKDIFGSGINKNVSAMPSKCINDDKRGTSGKQPAAQMSRLKRLQKIKSTKAVVKETRCSVCDCSYQKGCDNKHFGRWVGCEDGCGVWTHRKCIEWTEKDVDTNTYYCSTCSQQHK